MSIAYVNPGGLPPSAHIEVTPGVCGGKPCITNTRIRVQDIVIYYDRFGQSAEEIVNRYPQLSLADVYAALAYYFDHREAMDAQMRQGLAVIEEARRLFPSKLPTAREPEK
jgi:uncharacterized protein (DUF433 family)